MYQPTQLESLNRYIQSIRPNTCRSSKPRCAVGSEHCWRAELAQFHIIPMSDHADRTLQRRLLLGALVCAVTLIAGYFIFVSPPWGHQFDDDAYFGRRALSRKVVKLDFDLLNLVSKTTLLLAAMVLLIIAAVRRCALVGIITVAAFGCAVVGAEVVKNLLPWRALVPDDALLGRGLEANNSYPSGHVTIGTSLALSLLLNVDAVLLGLFSA